MENKEIIVNVPTIPELLDSLKPLEELSPYGDESIRIKDEIVKCYGYEMSSLFGYTKGATKPSVYLGLFIKQGSQWIADFSVNDLGKEVKNEFNWHGQNTSRWQYAGCILFDEKDKLVSTHH